MSLRESVEKLHAEISELTGRPERFMFHERSYAELLKFYSQDEAGIAGLAADLRLLIRYLQRQISAGSRNQGCLKIRNLLSPDRFDEDLAEARAFFKRRAQRSNPPQSAPATASSKSQPLPNEEWNQKAGEARKQIAELKTKLRANPATGGNAERTHPESKP